MDQASDIAAVERSTAQERDEQKSVRDRLVEVAARHFAEHGIQGASQRAIQREVGVNVATANYYFGSKEALYRAVIEDALSHVVPAREAGLRAIPKGLGRREATRALMHAYIAPHLEEMRTEAGYYYARLLASLHVVVPHAAVAVIEERVHPTREHYLDALSRLYPHVSRTRLAEVQRLGIGLMAVTPSWLGHVGMEERALARVIDDVVETATAAFETLLTTAD